MIIKPYSALATEPQNITSEFTFVKHFFQCNETSGATLSDSVGDVVINFAGLSNPNAYSVQSTSTAVQDTAGTWSTAGTKKVVIFAVAHFDNLANFTFGAAGQPQFNLRSSLAPLVTDGGNTVSGTNYTLTTADTTYGRAFVIATYNAVGGAQTYQFNTTDTSSALTATDTTGLTTMPAIYTGAGGFRMSISKPIYGVVWMEFDTLPANLKVGLAWMTYQWSIGNKVIYPGWKGL